MMPSRKPIILLTLLATTVVAFSIFITQAHAQEQNRSDTPVLPANLLNYEAVTLPPQYLNPDVRNTDNTPANNPITNEGATLGRVLFYDIKLSANDTVSCASCHQQENGFSDSAEFSTGFNGGLTGRHSMGLSNARFYQNGRFFWDERAATLENQVLLPIQDNVEMGMSLSDLETKLAAISYYPALFEAAFGTPDVTQDRISLALAQFVRSIVSFDSKFDAGLTANPPFSNFTRQERDGQQLFNGNRARCSRCHETDAFIADRARNIGLPNTNGDNGAGNGEFKVTSLRNIELTAPYMHDGRFDTLEQVIDHYSDGVQNNPGLDQILRNNNGQPRRPNFNQQETDALIAFLNTLTDDSLATDERFSDPFPLTAAPTSVTLLPMETVAPPTDILLVIMGLLAGITVAAAKLPTSLRR